MAPFGIELSTRENAPIVRVPDDILHHILYLSVAGPLCCIRDTGEDWIGCVVISYVCRYWRQFVLTSPQLWSCSYLLPGLSIPLLYEILSRSKDASLHVSVKGSSHILDEPERPRRQASILVAHVDRIVEFETNTLHERELKAILECLQDPAPQLQSLSL